MLSIGNWMKLYRLERFPRHLVIHFQFLQSPALWKLLLLVVKGEQQWDEAQLWKAGSLCSQIISGLLKSPWVPLRKTNSYQKKMSSISPFAGLSSVLAFALCDGEREQAIKEISMAFPAGANVPVCPTAPHGLHHSRELLELDCLVTPPAQPKMPDRLGTALTAGTRHPSPGK